MSGPSAPLRLPRRTHSAKATTDSCGASGAARRRRTVCTGVGLALASSLGLGACKKGQDTPSTDPSALEGGSTGTDADAVDSTRAPVAMIRWQFDFQALDATLNGAEALLAQLRPEAPMNLHAVVDAFAAQQGFGPEFTSSLDWTRRASLDFAYPQPEQDHARPDDLQLRGALPLKPGAGATALGGISQTLAPEAIDASLVRAMWGSVELWVRDGGDYLTVARAREGLDAATAMPRRAVPSEVYVRVENMHPGDVDPGELLDLPGGLGRPISAALARAKSAELQAELAPDKDLRLHVQADADLSDFGFDPLGPARTEPSALAAKLPPGPVMVVEMSWGDPKLVHRELERYGQMIPEPFDAWTADILKGAHATLDTLRDEVIVALYVNESGEAALVLAAGVQGDATRKAVHSIWKGVAELAERYATLVDDADFRIDLEFKPEGMSLSGGKVDLLGAKVPKSLKEDAKRLSMWLGAKKPKLEVLTSIEDEWGIVAIGAGARSVMSEWMRYQDQPRRVSAETDGGLALARRVGGGCQLCIAIEPVSAVRTWLTHRRDFDGDAEAGTQLTDWQRSSSANFALSMRASDVEAAIGLGAPRALLDAQPPILPALVKLAEPAASVEGPSSGPDQPAQP